MLQDRTVPTFIKADKYNELKTKDDSDILDEVYEVNQNGNYFLINGIEERKKLEIYAFMDNNQPSSKGVTILAIEEPEAHLHPVNQRLIYRDVIKNNNHSVLLTTHSTHITSIAPIESIVHLHAKKDEGTKINATADMPIGAGEFLDVERYLDVKRGEIYMGKAVILVEGIAEEYLVPKFAELLGKPLNEKGIIVCNVNSTNFTPYVKLLRNLEIPYAVITDGDYYYIDEDDEKVYHSLDDTADDHEDIGYLGVDLINQLVTDLELVDEDKIPEEIDEQDELFRTLGFYIGNCTFEVDMMKKCKNHKPATQTIIDIFNQLTEGGDKQKANFKKEIESGEYWKCLNKIEGNGIGKGRFAQILSTVCLKEHIPNYIEKAINYIYQKVDVL
jgi:putative ATP-dependent endonuclease of OLD family